MFSLWTMLHLIHLIGFSLGIGCATVKLMLLLKCNADYTFTPLYIKVSKFITRPIVLGMILMTLSGIGWLFVGYDFTPVLIIKIILVAVIWVTGPLIDNVVEPKFHKLAPAAGETASLEFVRVLKQFLMLEAFATGLFYVIFVMWVLR